MIRLRQTRLQRLRELRDRALDLAFAPVFSRLTVEQYFRCRTRRDCLRALLSGR